MKKRPTLFTKSLLAAVLVLANISHANTPSTQQNDNARKAQAELRLISFKVFPFALSLFKDIIPTEFKTGTTFTIEW